MTPEVKQELEQILYHSKEPFKRVMLIKALLDRTPTIDPKNAGEAKNEHLARSSSENKKLHAWCAACAKVCLDQGLDARALFGMFKRIDVPMSTDMFKKMFVHPVIKVKFGIDSTTKLKMGQIGEIPDPIMKAFGEQGIELPPFEEEGVRMSAMENLKDNDYPEYDESLHKPTI